MDYKENRVFLKYPFQFDLTDADSINTLWKKVDSDQSKGLPAPPAEKPYKEEDLIPLPNPKDTILKKRDIFDILDSRESRRTPSIPHRDITLNELSFILWSVQGVRINNNPTGKRTVPSGGGRYPFDTYFLVSSVENLKAGLYRYVWSEHAITSVSISDENIAELQRRFDKCALTIMWVVVPYRCEWRYTQLSHKVCALDAGHMAQNGYLAAEALELGCCAVGAYSQVDIDKLIGVDGVDEFTCYIEAFM